eukprot:g27541.t1
MKADEEDSAPTRPLHWNKTAKLGERHAKLRPPLWDTRPLLQETPTLEQDLHATHRDVTYYKFIVVPIVWHCIKRILKVYVHHIDCITLIEANISSTNS